MKKVILYTSLFAVGLMTALSCNLNTYPVFDDDDAFVAFESTSYSFQEPTEEGTTVQVNIPVTLASVAGLSASVPYTVENGTAVLGQDFSIADPDMTLTFDAANRTQNITIDILSTYVGTYSGSKSFTIRLGESSVNLGAENTCTVTITDSDHPLTDILYTYGMTGESLETGPEAWDLTFDKDPGDVTIVWIKSGAVAGDATAGFYGTVTSSDGVPTSISFVLGQASSEDADYVLYGINSLGEIVKSGTMMVSVSNQGENISFPEYGPCLYSLSADSPVDRILPGASGIRNQE